MFLERSPDFLIYSAMYLVFVLFTAHSRQVLITKTDGTVRVQGATIQTEGEKHKNQIKKYEYGRHLREIKTKKKLTTRQTNAHYMHINSIVQLGLS